MKTLLIGLSVVCMVIWSEGFGQGDSPCAECICVADNTCTGSDGCGNPANCGSVLFTANCDWTYTLKYELKCTTARCDRCYACAFVVDERTGQTIGGPIHGDCLSPFGCSGTTSVTLTDGTQYRLYSCLKHCWGYDRDDCAGCTARAYVYANPGDCNVMPPCNP